MPLVEKAVIDRAVRNVARWGDTDIFPFPFENHVFYDKPDELSAILADLIINEKRGLEKYPPQSYSTLVPVTSVGFRWATQIDPVWNAHLLALVLSLAPKIEDFRVPKDARSVFSYRILKEPVDDQVYETGGWREFQDQSRELARQHSYVVAVDIADFYPRVYHHRLENALRTVDPDGAITKQIMDVVGRLSSGASYGLPVGGPAARILAELVLDTVDRLLLASPATATFCRYADDYRFFVDSPQAAYHAIALISERLQLNEGLSLQKSKSRIMTSAEYLALLEPADGDPGTAASFMSLKIHYDPYSANAVAEYQGIKDKINEFDVFGLLRAELGKGRIHVALTRRLVGALKYLDPAQRLQAMNTILDNTDALGPVLPQCLQAIRICLDLDDTSISDVTMIHSRVRALITDDHPLAKLSLNLQYMIRILARAKSTENEDLLVHLYSGPHGYSPDASPAIQRDVMLILARWNVRYWLTNEKQYFPNRHPWVQRAFVASSFALGDEGRHWRRAQVQQMGSFTRLVADWASERKRGTVFEIPT